MKYLVQSKKFSVLKQLVKLRSNEDHPDINDVLGKYGLNTAAHFKDMECLLINLSDELVDYEDGSFSVSVDEVKAEVNQVAVEMVLNGRNAPSVYGDFICFLSRSNVEKFKSFSNEVWNDVLYIYFELIRRGENRWWKLIKLQLQQANLNCRILKEMRKYKITFADGKFNYEKTKYLKIVRDIESLVVEVGAIEFLAIIFDKLSSKYSYASGRYLQPRFYDSGTNRLVLQIPYMYLIMLCVKNIHSYPSKKNKSVNTKICKIILLSSNLVFMHDCYQFNRYSDMLMLKSGYRYVLDTIKRNLMYDELFKLKQLGEYYVCDFLEGLLKLKDSSAVERKLGFRIKDYFSLVKKIYAFPKRSMVLFKENYFLDSEIKILNAISHGTMVNDGYGLPKNASKVGNLFLSKPLIRIESDYLLIDKCLCGWGFYEVIMLLLGHKYSSDIGKNIEEIIKNKFIDSGFTVHSGEYLGSSRECDLVVEEQCHVSFFEVKKKSITRKSVEGNETAIIGDLVDSFFHAQEQILAHEKHLVNNGKMKFKTGSTLVVGDKDIEKISMSLFESSYLNTRGAASSIFDFIRSVEFKENRNKMKGMKLKDRVKASRFVKSKNKLIKRVNKELFEMYGDDDELYRYEMHSVWFNSLEFICFLVDQAGRREESFCELLQKVKSITCNSSDIFYEYEYSVGLSR
ncbi:hypothetical protein D0S45_03845 [Marinifilum sp. JC120]|nr:hypothetical protein D0S45_03845 [Marinifilum sp. JC120]